MSGLFSKAKATSFLDHFHRAGAAEDITRYTHFFLKKIVLDSSYKPEDVSGTEI